MLRLLVPLVAAVFTHISLQVYFERVSHGQFSGSYLEFLPHYFDGVYLPGGDGNFAFHSSSHEGGSRLMGHYAKTTTAACSD